MGKNFAPAPSWCAPFKRANSYKNLQLISLLPQNAFQASEIDVQVAVIKNEPLKSFRKAVLIVIATKSMKNSPPRLFSDEDLMDILSTVLGRVCSIKCPLYVL